MNPEQIARQAMIARMGGSPMPQATQVSQGAGIQVPTAQVPAQMPAGDRQLGDEQRKPNESDTLAKTILPGTAHPDMVVQAHAKAILQKLIPYLGK